MGGAVLVAGLILKKSTVILFFVRIAGTVHAIIRRLRLMLSPSMKQICEVCGAPATIMLRDVVRSPSLGMIVRAPDGAAHHLCAEHDRESDERTHPRDAVDYWSKKEKK